MEIKHQILERIEDRFVFAYKSVDLLAAEHFVVVALLGWELITTEARSFWAMFRGLG